MANKKESAIEKYLSLKSDLADVRFASKGHLGEASKAIEPILHALESTDKKCIPVRISKTFKSQLETEISNLERAGLKRVIRISDPKLASKQVNGNLGFTRWIDASREWRECEIWATVLERYIDVRTGECVIEYYDEAALLTLRQSRHIRASEQKNNKEKDVYVREHYNCLSCGAELEHIADETNCPFCGAFIAFHFFDWQVDSFYLDMHKENLLNGVKNIVSKAAVTGVDIAAKTAEVLADAWDERDRQSRSKTDNNDNNNYLGGIITVVIFVMMLLFIAFFSLPFYIRIAIALVAIAFIIRAVVKILKATDQSRKKKKIVRYSDGYLRNCVYNEVWKQVEAKNLIDFSIDDISIKSVDNTESTTAIDVSAVVIKKYLCENTRINVAAENITIKFSRARYPERLKTKGKTIAEKECPSCGANFEPDKWNCCSYCGYGLKIENFVWKRTN